MVFRRTRARRTDCRSESLEQRLLLTTMPDWTHLSQRIRGFGGTQRRETNRQASLILDVDKDGLNDFVIAERTQTPSVVLYKRESSGGWTKHIIEKHTTGH